MSNLLWESIDYFRSDYPDIDYLKEIKSGKEATVHLVQAEGRYMALKIYREHTQNSARGEYMSTNHLDARTQRALKNNSRHGRAVETSLWTKREFTMLELLHNSGANVPEVFAHSGQAILMEFIGEGEDPAPRLVDVRLEQEVARETYRLLLENVELFWDLNIVHGDLSAYNILWFQDRPYIIDFPQALDVRQNRNAREKYERDLANIRSFFYGYLA